MKMIKDLIGKCARYYRVFETASLVFFLFLIFLIAVLQIFLKKIPGTEFLNPLIKYCVLWAGMISACIATYEGKHIKIDIIGRFAKGRLKQLVLTITNLFGSIVCFILFVTFIFYIFKIEYTSAQTPPFFNMPRWMLLLIMPYGFFIISLRFAVQAGKRLVCFIKNQIPEEHEEAFIGKGKESE
jgi:TRAP-type C4-dicarboxylate transport system permease small subunit